MGKKNTLMKDYMSEPAHFADCFNHYLFHGKRVIQSEHLKSLDPMEMAIIPRDTTEATAEKIRDILKSCILMQDDRRSYLLLGIENQSDIHYALPVKNMSYDALNYAKQVSEIGKEHRLKKDIKDSGEFLSGFTKEDKLKPIITLTVYFGADEWDGPRSLKEMFEEIDDGIMEYVEDYKVHLLIPKEIEDFTKFATDFGKVMKYIAVSEDKEALRKIQADEWFQNVSADSVRLLNACTNSNIKVEEGEVTVDMCEGLRALLEEKENEGIEKGLEKGIEKGLTLGENQKLRSQVQKKLAKGYSVEEIAEMLEEKVEKIATIIEEVQQK